MPLNSSSEMRVETIEKLHFRHRHAFLYKNKWLIGHLSCIFHDDRVDGLNSSNKRNIAY